MRELELLGGQMIVATLVLFVLFLMAVAFALANPRDDIRFVLAVVALVVPALFAVSALKHRVQANWLAPAYLPAAVLLALELDRRNWTKWFHAGCALGGASLLLFYTYAANPLLFPDVRIAIDEGDWGKVAEHVAAVRDRMGRSVGSTWLAANRYQDASKLAFTLPDHPTVFSLNIGGRQNQYDLWPGFAQTARPGDSIVLLLAEPKNEWPLVVAALTPHFDRVEQGELVELRSVGSTVLQRRIWVLEGWLGSWPIAPSVAAKPATRDSTTRTARAGSQQSEFE